jgi:protocatechuate 3,4-dioxygenase beta subunit
MSSRPAPPTAIPPAITRRHLLGVLGAAGAAAAVGCSDGPTSPSSNSSTTTPVTGSTNATCAVTPSETAGPFPSRTDMFRPDIREGRAGTALTLTVKVVNVNSACAAVANADVEIWHCDEVGNYSQYGTVANQTFYRGIQTTNASGEAVFTTNYPGWYQGRATHIHIEAVMGGRSVKVSQIAFPEAVNNTVHATGVYASRGSNPIANASDGIFADSLESELVTPTGSVASGFAATFQLGVAI